MTHQLPGSEAARRVIVEDLRRFCFVILKFVRPAVATPTERQMWLCVSSARRGHWPQTLQCCYREPEVEVRLWTAACVRSAVKRTLPHTDRCWHFKRKT